MRDGNVGDVSGVSVVPILQVVEGPGLNVREEPQEISSHVYFNQKESSKDFFWYDSI